MTQKTRSETQFLPRLFVRLNPATAIISKGGPLLCRYGAFRRPRVKLPPVTHGCSLTVDEQTGMRAIRAALLLAEINARLAFMGDL